MPSLAARALEKDLPEVERAVRADKVNSLLFSYRDKKLMKAGLAVDTGFLGKENALGKVLEIEDKGNFTITGILKDLPDNTRFDFEYMLSCICRFIGHYDSIADGNLPVIESRIG